jgi:hypothetical protein
MRLDCQWVASEVDWIRRAGWLLGWAAVWIVSGWAGCLGNASIAGELVGSLLAWLVVWLGGCLVRWVGWLAGWAWLALPVAWLVGWALAWVTAWVVTRCLTPTNHQRTDHRRKCRGRNICHIHCTTFQKTVQTTSQEQILLLGSCRVKCVFTN